MQLRTTSREREVYTAVLTHKSQKKTTTNYVQVDKKRYVFFGPNVVDKKLYVFFRPNVSWPNISVIP